MKKDIHQADVAATENHVATKAELACQNTGTIAKITLLLARFESKKPAEDIFGFNLDYEGDAEVIKQIKKEVACLNVIDN